MTNTINQPADSQTSYSIAEWKRGYDSQPNEYEYEITEIEGAIPTELSGTLFRNGPGLLDIGGSAIHHPFDGDGMISAFSFQDGKAFYRNRFVQTEAYLQEQEAGKILYRGVFGTQKPGGFFKNVFDLKLKNIANTGVIYWGGKLLALWEAAEPHRLDPETLDTLGIDYLDGVLQPGDAFSAHPWVDPSCVMDDGAPCLVNFRVDPGLSSKITLFEFAPDGKLLRRHSHSIPGFSFIHDFIITPQYAIFFQNPVNFNPLPFLFGMRGAGECVQFQPEKPTNVILIPRDSNNREIKTFSVESGFVFHHANAFEREKEICIDSIAYQTLPQVQPNSDYKEVDFDPLDPGQLWRFTLNLEDGRVEREMLEGRCCEFPTHNPNKVGRDYRYLYLGAAADTQSNAPLQAILKLDLETNEGQIHSFAPRGFVSEPIFVSKPNSEREDSGWILTLVYDGKEHRSTLAILDGENLAGDAVALLHLKHHIPYGLHGSWCDEVFVKAN
ncbi:carotenoid oxygenase family protein [Waterburya agarophytonicola K14]|uniref:Carotenoid oxygenase family protein n=1 Tax=Waterburya agarophytonicola KI4 TaxID=2874699 RepID=A0A964FGQ2_9CYAN|nr:carotenoid oxygenase family protein [Waterburya agarophytonicola]MCC0178287.1 carotenoid oxygenase family protein [Waterburya agarophytonicola KI4]